jgi:hypothetical protein
LKIAKVIPIFKKGDKTNLNNYRPISLLPVISKVFEKVLNNQLTDELNCRNLIDENQYGFRSGHSTEDAIMKFVDQIEKELLAKKHVVSIYIDVSKAFDSCNHEILLKKLKRIGLSTNSLKLMNTYLKDRIQEVWVNDKNGGRIKTNIGVGQGTVLGPTLFKIYILDMYLATNLFSSRFADDTSLIGSGENKEDTETYINMELEKLYNWFCTNKLTLHPDKSRFIVHTKEKLLNIKLGNKPIMRCGYNLQEEGVKLLGVIIDENLDWKLQINSVKKKIGKGNYLLWRHKTKLTQSMSKTIYESFVRCHITYCLAAWGGKSTATMNELKTILKKSWSKIGPRRIHTNTRLLDNNILKLDHELKVCEAKIVWRWENKKLPDGLKNIIIERNENNLRNRSFIRNMRWKTTSIAYRLATRAKNEIREVSKAKTLAMLKNNYRLSCKQEYMEECKIRNCYICNQNPR